MAADGTTAERRQIDVCVVLFNDGYVSEAAIPSEVFHSAGELYQRLLGETPEPRFRVTTATVDGKPVQAPYGEMKLQPACSIADVTKTDIIIVPASGGLADPQYFAILPWLRKHYEAGAYIAGICTGAVYLAEAGLLDNKLATTHWAMGKGVEQIYPKVKWRIDMMVTEDSRLLCGGGVTSSSDVSLFLVEKLCGREIAVQTAKILLLSMPRTHQSGYAMLPLSPPHGDERIRAVEAFIQRNFRDALSTERLAEEACMSERNFLRRFKTATGRVPAAYLQAVRIEAAKSMLERSKAPVQTISEHVGYDDASFFRMLFKRTTGMTPGEYRTHFTGLTMNLPDGIGGEDLRTSFEQH